MCIAPEGHHAPVTRWRHQPSAVEPDRMTKPPRRPMRLVNLRIPEQIHEEIQRVSQDWGISVAQYLREAALMRLARDEVVDAVLKSGAPPRDVVHAFGEAVAREAERLGAPEMAEKLRGQYRRE